MKKCIAGLIVGVILLGGACGVWAGAAEGVAALNRGDYASALRELRIAAEEGSADAQANLGVMYLNGLGVSQNDQLAAHWMHKAAEQGVALAQQTITVGRARDLLAALRQLSNSDRD